MSGLERITDSRSSIAPRLMAPSAGIAGSTSVPSSAVRIGYLSAGFSHARRLFDRTAAFDPILEGADVEHLAKAHVLEYLGSQRGTSAGCAVQDDGLVLGEILVVVGRLGIGAKFQHAARDMYRAGNLAALLNLRRVAHVDHQGVALVDHLARLSRRDLRNRGVGGFHHLLYACRHLCLLS